MTVKPGEKEDMAMNSACVPIPCTIAPWLTVRNGEQALRFYREAFGATVVYQLKDPSAGVVARLSVGGAEFWLSDGQPDESGAESLGGGSVRMILTVGDPDTVFAQALVAGASKVFPVGEAHGWRLGRLVDPFGLHWEIGLRRTPKPARKLGGGPCRLSGEQRQMASVERQRKHPSMCRSGNLRLHRLRSPQ
jgi:PhnB protein